MLRTMLLLAWPVAAWAGPKHDAVMDLLGASEDPVRQADLVALGDGVDAELMAIALDPEVPTTRRGRALGSLQYYATDGVRHFLEAQLAEPTGHSLLRRTAAASLAAWGPVAVPVLAHALSDADLQVRIAVARALGRIVAPSAKQALQARLRAEIDATAKQAITASLAVQR
jgi:HEAT repeat protein